MDKEALTEVNYIIEAMPQEENNRIPKKFKDFIKAHMSFTYEPNIDLSRPLEEQKLKKDTITMFSLIYRNYFCTKEVRDNLLEQDKIALQKENIQALYDDSLFNDNEVINTSAENITDNNTNIAENADISSVESIETEMEQEAIAPAKIQTNFITRIIQKIKGIFASNKNTK